MSVGSERARPRKNAREDYRYLTDAEFLTRELERAMGDIRSAIAQLRPAHDEEYDARLSAVPPTDYTAEALALIGRVKGQMYLARLAHGVLVSDLATATGWAQPTISKFENQEADALVSSLVRYAAGLRAVGVPGRIEIRWVPDEPATEKEAQA